MPTRPMISIASRRAARRSPRRCDWMTCATEAPTRSTGVSAVIDGRGNVVKELPWHSAGVIDAVLPPGANSPTPFARWGNAIPLFLAVLLIAGGIVLGRKRR